VTTDQPQRLEEHLVLERSVTVIFQNVRRALIANTFLATLVVISSQAVRASALGWLWVLSVLAAFGARMAVARRFFALTAAPS
jgi:pheromone shutdown protein TraB